MLKSVIPSGAKNGKLSRENKRKNLSVLAKTPRLKRLFFQQIFLSSNVKIVALTRTVARKSTIGGLYVRTGGFDIQI